MHLLIQSSFLLRLLKRYYYYVIGIYPLRALLALKMFYPSLIIFSSDSAALLTRFRTAKSRTSQSSSCDVFFCRSRCALSWSFCFSFSIFPLFFHLQFLKLSAVVIWYCSFNHILLKILQYLKQITFFRKQISLFNCWRQRRARCFTQTLHLDISC